MNLNLESAILEGLADESMTQGEIYRYLRTEMNPHISWQDAEIALGGLLHSHKVREIISIDPFGVPDGMPSLYEIIGN